MEKIKDYLNKREEILSPYACKSSEVIRLKDEKEDIRPAFFHDADRILYSLSFNRYVDKTQVFSYEESDHISRRMTHVQYVSKIARTIGRMLALNEDLIEASAFGHDLGHTPLGHIGETILNKISREVLGENFMHNIQSVRVLMNLDRNGKGSNISVQVLDAIMCHNGEIVDNVYRPVKKTKEEFLKEYQDSYYDKEVSKTQHPMTLEGCVVRISDVIAYIGKDIEDAIRINIITSDDIPKEIADVLGNTNSQIVNALVLDVVKNSLDKNYIAMSPEAFKALNALKDFNYKNIYYKANTKETLTNYENQIRYLFNKYLNYLDNDKKDSLIYRDFISTMTDEYKEENSNSRKVIDFISGMTDDYLKKQYDYEKNLETYL